MNLLPQLSAATLCLMLAAFPLAAQSVQWERLSGPEGGTARSMARTPDGVLFSTIDRGGLYRSNDNGASWTHLPLQIPPHEASLVHTTPEGTLLLATPDSILYRSTDLGSSWRPVMVGGYWSIPLVNDSGGGVINIGLHDLYRSTDDGLSWTTLDHHFDEDISAFTVGADGRLVAAVEESFSPRGIRLSTDLGVTWRHVQIGDSTTPTVLSLAATPDGRLYAGTGGGGLFRSDDSGASWVLLPLLKPEYYSALLALPDGSILTGTGSRGVFRSTDGGVTWDSIGPTTAGVQLLSLGSTGSGEILAGTYGSGIYLVRPGNWVHASRGLPPQGVQSVVVAADQQIYTVAYDGRFYTSSDNGADWIEPGFRMFFGSAMTLGRDGRAYVVDGRWPTFGASWSTDRGVTWTPGTSGMENEMVLVLAVDRNDHIYAAVERGPFTFFHSETDGLFRSTDHGASWSAIGTGLTGVTPQAVVTLSDGTLFVGSRYYSRVLRLTPGDTIWRDVSIGLPSTMPLNALVADNAGNLHAATDSGLYRSTDRGASWQLTGPGVADTSIAALVVAATGRIFAATNSHGVVASDDNGASWHRYGDPGTLQGFQVLAVDSTGRLYAGNATGLYRATGTSSVPMQNTGGSAGLALGPNPTGAHTAVRFEIFNQGDVRLVLYTSTGEEAGVLLQGVQTRGTHRIEVDLSGYASGNYILRLETGEGSEETGVAVVR